MHRAKLNHCVQEVATAICLLASCAPQALPGQVNPPSDESPSLRSLQRQVDELAAGQRQILKELEAIRQLLREQQARVQSAAAPVSQRVFAINVHGEPFRGENGARVAIMEYSDFECPYCGEYAARVYPRVEKEYIGTGKVKYFFRDLPAKEHPHSFLAAQAARCAGDQGKFWEMHDLLFVAQSELGRSNLLSHARTLALDTAAFQECLSSGGHSNQIQLSIETARRMGIYGTPAFLVGTLSKDGDFLRGSKILIGGEAETHLVSALEELLASQATAKAGAGEPKRPPEAAATPPAQAQ